MSSESSSSVGLYIGNGNETTTFLAYNVFFSDVSVVVVLPVTLIKFRSSTFSTVSTSQFSRTSMLTTGLLLLLLLLFLLSLRRTSSFSSTTPLISLFFFLLLVLLNAFKNARRNNSLNPPFMTKYCSPFSHRSFSIIISLIPISFKLAPKSVA